MIYVIFTGKREIVRYFRSVEYNPQLDNFILTTPDGETQYVNRDQIKSIYI